MSASSAKGARPHKARRAAATGGTSVMAQRAPKTVDADSELERLWRTLDFFPTPPWAARAGAELLDQLDPGPHHILEPACGEGHMAGPLAEFYQVTASDVYPHGFGDVRDWLDDAAWPEEPAWDWMLTNPPFIEAENFVRVGLRRVRRGVGILVRLAFLETEGRFALLYEGGTPVTWVCPFAERVAMTLGKWDPAASSATAYAWLFFAKPEVVRLNHPPGQLRPVAPGTKARLWKPEDARRYGWAPPAPLLELLTGYGDSQTPVDKVGAGAPPEPPAPVTTRQREEPKGP